MLGSNSQAQLLLMSALTSCCIVGDQVAIPMRIVSVRYGVEDIDRALDCYVRCLGLEVVSRTQIGGHEVAAVSAGGSPWLPPPPTWLP